MSRWWLVIALLLSVGLNVGILAAIGARRAAMPGPQEGRPQNQADAAKPANNDPVPRLARLADRLKLEGETRRKFLDIQWNLYQETTRLRLDLGEVHRALRKELTRPDADRQRVEALLTESSRLYLALERSLVNNVFATRELLGPEKEAEYLKVVGRLRVPNPGPGIMNPSAEPQQKPGMLERMRQRRMRQQQRRQENPP
jgi:Spy/CpxP family protein refolding chaperone